MHLLWGTLIVVAGLFLLICGRLKSEFFIYRSIVARIEDTMGREYTSFSPDCRSNCHRSRSVGGSWVHLIGILQLAKQYPSCRSYRNLEQKEVSDEKGSQAKHEKLDPFFNDIGTALGFSWMRRHPSGPSQSEGTRRKIHFDR